MIYSIIYLDFNAVKYVAVFVKILMKIKNIAKYRIGILG